MIGLIGGSSLLESHALAALTQVQIDTPYGAVLIRVDAAQTLAFCQRHMADPAHEVCSNAPESLLDALM